jgi:hypothetical protein
VALPIANNTMGNGAIAVGGGDDFCMLHKEPEYSLPFKVEGYFDLHQCELSDDAEDECTRAWGRAAFEHQLNEMG